MEPELKQADYSEGVTEKTPDINMETAGTLAPFATTSGSQEQVQQILDTVKTYLSNLPEFLGKFFAEYRQPLTVIGLIFGGFVSVKLTLALLDAINDIPLLAPLFELVGITYTAWFIYRYVFFKSSRAELSAKYSNLKSQIVGKE